MLKFSLCSSILFPNSVSILITNALNSLSGNLFTSISLLIFSGVSLALSVETSSSAFSFCLTFSASMNLHETVVICYSPEGCPYVAVSLYRLHFPPAFGGRAGFDLRVCWQLSPW